MSDFEKAINMLEHMVSTSIPAPQMRRMVREAIVVLNREARCKREREAAALPHLKEDYANQNT